MSGSPTPTVDPLAKADRCAHELPVKAGCVRCGTKAPTSDAARKHHPHLWEPRYGRTWAQTVPARRDRRAAGDRPTAFRRATARARWSGHPLGLPTSYGRVIRPTRPESPAAAAHRERRHDERDATMRRQTRAELLVALREDNPHATRSHVGHVLRYRAAAARRKATT